MLYPSHSWQGYVRLVARSTCIYELHAASYFEVYARMHAQFEAIAMQQAT